MQAIIMGTLKSIIGEKLGGGQEMAAMIMLLNFNNGCMHC